jgi:hypothetical protein
VLFWLTLQSFHQSTLWELLVPEEGTSRDSHLGEVEFEPLVEIVNPIPAGHWSFRDYEERETEVDISARADQRMNKRALYRLARYAPNDNLVTGPGTRREW